MVGARGNPKPGRVKALEDDYRPVGRMRVGELLLRHPDALRFIEDCGFHKILILGMDFYREQGDTLVPLLASADLSPLLTQPDAVQRTTECARMIVEDGFPDGAEWVTFILRTEEDSAAA
jgi:hypothetical protein